MQSPRTSVEQIHRISCALKLNCSPNDVIDLCKAPCTAEDSSPTQGKPRVRNFSVDIDALQSNLKKNLKAPPNKYKPRRSKSADIESLQKIQESSILQMQYLDISKLYDFHDEAGRGSFGVVRKCSFVLSGEIHACKTILKSDLLHQRDLDQVYSEVKLLQTMQCHPNVVKMQGAYEDSKSIHLVMEYCNGGDLVNRIKDKGCFTERKAAKIVSKIASVLATAHEKGIMHRDIKPENILLVSNDSDTDIRLADFGSATSFEHGKKLRQLIGSPLYIAPSVLKRSYGTEADLWSLGVVMYILLTGIPPFSGKNNSEMFKNIKEAALNHRLGSSDGWLGLVR